MFSEYIAHVRQAQNGEWVSHLLTEHLSHVAELAARFAGNRGGQYAKAAGLLHDLGKAQQAWQCYLAEKSGFEKENAHLEEVECTHSQKIPHFTAGARYAVNQLEPLIGHILAYLIAGHHAGLADWHDKGSLKARLQVADKELTDALQGWRGTGLEESFFELAENKLIADFPAFLSREFQAELHIWLRFLFSCLVDADFLDTEAFMNGYANADEAKAVGLRPDFASLSELHASYERYMADLAKKASDSPLNQERNAILQQCFQAALLDKSVFSLTVPTGGGKTLASLGFALKHALKFGKKRIICAIPFTSIIEQNADVFRKVLGSDVVLEHHSNLEVSENQETVKTRLATEN